MACKICWGRVEKIRELRAEYRQLCGNDDWCRFELTPNGRVEPNPVDREATEEETRGARILEWVLGETARIDSCCGLTERKTLLRSAWPDFPFSEQK